MTAPVDVVVQSPPVTLRNVTLTAQLAKDAEGVMRAIRLARGRQRAHRHDAER